MITKFSLQKLETKCVYPFKICVYWKMLHIIWKRRVSAGNISRKKNTREIYLENRKPRVLLATPLRKSLKQSQTAKKKQHYLKKKNLHNYWPFTKNYINKCFQCFFTAKSSNIILHAAVDSPSPRCYLFARFSILYQTTTGIEPGGPSYVIKQFRMLNQNQPCFILFCFSVPVLLLNFNQESGYKYSPF